MYKFSFICFLFASLLSANSAMAFSDRGYPSSPTFGKILKNQRNYFTVRNSHGGNVARFAIRAAQLQKKGTTVKFAGRCDSACTLYLGLPRSQTCITRGASFRFHAPVTRSGKSSMAAHRFMYASYPGWVRSWISSKGGMTRRLITMDYAYASNFLPQC
jgi:hypothetical protein